RAGERPKKRMRMRLAKLRTSLVLRVLVFAVLSLASGAAAQVRAPNGRAAAFGDRPEPGPTLPPHATPPPTVPKPPQVTATPQPLVSQPAGPPATLQAPVEPAVNGGMPAVPQPPVLGAAPSVAPGGETMPQGEQPLAPSAPEVGAAGAGGGLSTET